MLFVSRYYGYIDIGIVDTDDGTEEIVSPGDIIDVVIKSGVDIKGFKAEDRLLSFQPYQPGETKTQLQLKMQLLHNVEVVTYKSAITNIRWPSGRGIVDIRLSDFGQTCTDFILRGNTVIGGRCARLIFDDKLEPVSQFAVAIVCPPAISFHRDVLYDLTEVTDNALAESIYASILQHREWPNYEFLPVPGEVLRAVVDNKDRKQFMARKLIRGSLWR